MDEPFDVREARAIRIGGDASGSSNPFVKTAERLVVGDTPLHLDVSQLSLSDEYAVTQCVNALRELLIRGARIVVTGAPECLKDGATRAGLLSGPGLTVDLRGAAPQQQPTP